jgi:predicted RecA/RadA family phage recombinase
MTKFVQSGQAIEFTAPGGGVTVDVPVLIGNILVIPTVTASAAARFVGMIRGVFRSMTKPGSQAWAEGARVYWDSGNSRFTTSGAGNLLVGFAVETVGSGASETTGTVFLTGVANESGT